MSLLLNFPLPRQEDKLCKRKDFCVFCFLVPSKHLDKASL